MKFSETIYKYQLLLIFLSLGLVSCKNNLVKIISFEAKQVLPGRPEQNIFTSYTLKFVSKEKSLEANSIRIIFNNDLEITPMLFNHNRTTYKLGDTVHCAFSTQNQFLPNQSYKLKYNNSKNYKQKNISQPLYNNTNIPKQ
ncbi:MAG: hypothetical protein ACK45U_01270 [bacterium]|jgi:hypothetical protein